MTITVLGATGATGRLVVQQLLSLGHPVLGAVRKPEKAAKSAVGGIEFVAFDLADPGRRFEEVFAATEIVVNAAATRTMTKKQADLIDRQGVIAAIDAAASAGVKRWIQVSMMGSGDPARLPRYLRATGQAKDAADAHLAESGMTWTVIRPPWLTDGAATGRITVGEQVPEGSLTRADLAAVAVASLDIAATHNRLFEVTGGGRPVTESLMTLG
ncbi:SDR family oxidoreductase [Streptomyces rubradiris]|uniref:NAD-dependent dehydratase n=1 Tax=Streptomyces rubradiris TaxID=285531 RepID=A0ABQ3RQR6_STRRR|nr:SDR family oxidoreductase [Streptomyces rubradiris]GHH24918.1 NAD-dependent dehydratase [Streptomyces rubradiris]GHI58204.1 NAD-dependent dehydratase [Streptomyces rubradiris]